MDPTAPELDSTSVQVGLAAEAYRLDRVRLVERDLRGFTHLLASRQGLFAVHESACRLIAHGFFFGITFRERAIYVFEACDVPREPSRRGRIIRLCMQDGLVIRAEVVLKGLDNGCHQIDIIDERLFVVDTYNQQLLRMHAGFDGWDVLLPLPRLAQRGGGPGYVHVNSLLAVGERRMLLLHHGARPGGRSSEIAVYSRDWQELERWPLAGSGCHGLALLEDGALLSCGSMEGNLISVQGMRLPVSPHLTRGLAVGADSMAIGASQKVERDGRLRNAGTVTFLDRDYRVRAVLPVPGAPTELRRLDEKDSSLSAYLQRVPWGGSIRPWRA